MEKILIVCSATFYEKISSISDKLIDYGYDVIYPNCYESNVTSEDNKNKSNEDYVNFYKEMYYESRNKISEIDEILVLNFDKNKNGILHKNYIGASTFLEMYEAFMQGKKIYIYNKFPDESNMLFEDIKGMNPICLNGNIELMKEI